jgi:hypothetical protein
LSNSENKIKLKDMNKFKIHLILLFLGFVISAGIMAQGPPTPPSDPNAGGNQSPSGAPIDPGTTVFLILAAAYGLKKAYGLKRKPE